MSENFFEFTGKIKRDRSTGFAYYHAVFSRPIGLLLGFIMREKKEFSISDLHYLEDVKQQKPSLDYYDIANFAPHLDMTSIRTALEAAEARSSKDNERFVKGRISLLQRFTG